MNISIIGAGHIGGTLARLLLKAGYEVAIANSRGPDSLSEIAKELGSKLHPVKVKDALTFSNIIIFSIPWRSIDSLPAYSAVGKIIVDTTNPYKSDGSYYDLGNDISSTKVIQHFPGAVVLKAFNTIWYMHLSEKGNVNLTVSNRRVIPVAGDDKKAKETLSKIIAEIGFGPLDTGSLKEGSRFQGIQGVLYNKDITVKEAASLIRKDNH